MPKHCVTIEPDGSSTEYRVEHGLGSDVVVAVKRLSGEMIFAGHRSLADHVVVSVGHPIVEPLRVVILG